MFIRKIAPSASALLEAEARKLMTEEGRAALFEESRFEAFDQLADELLKGAHEDATADLSDMNAEQRAWIEERAKELRQLHITGLQLATQFAIAKARVEDTELDEPTMVVDEQPTVAVDDDEEDFQ